MCSWWSFWCVFSFLVHGVRDSATPKLNQGRKTKWGEKAVRKTACNQPAEFLKLHPLFGRSKQHSLLADKMSTCLHMSDSQPVDTNFKGVPSVVIWLAASDLICVHSKSRSSAVLKLQGIIIKSHRSTVTLHERFVFAQYDSSQELLDAKKL